jgi:hypothetical protein
MYNLRRHETFLRRIGRTNVEYGTAEPVYGSSISRLNANAGKKVRANAS